MINKVILMQLFIISLACLTSCRQQGEIKARIFDKGDAGTSVLDDVTYQAPGQSTRAMKEKKLTLNAYIHVLGGGVRGFGVLAKYPANRFNQLRVSRSTIIRKQEPYAPVALIRISDPAGNVVSVTETTDQKTKRAEYDITLPQTTAAGVWTVSIIGGRLFDTYDIEMPKTDIWGIRGEMSLSVTDSVPNPAYLYVPASTRKFCVERYGGEKKSIAVYDNDNKLLGYPEVHPKSGKRNVLVVDRCKPDSVYKLDFEEGRKLAVYLDGVPGLLCPSPDVAKELKGGTVSYQGTVCGGPLQARARKWMLARKPEELNVETKAATCNPESIANPAAEAQICGTIKNVPATIAKQNLDKADPHYGTFIPAGKYNNEPSWQNFHYRLYSPWTLRELVDPAAIKSPINPYYKDPALIRRAALCGLSRIVKLQWDALPREHFLDDTKSAGYPITHAFFVYSSLAENYMLVKELLDDESAQIWEQGLMAMGDKLADNQGYQSNQWTHNLLGHICLYAATKKPRFLGYFERQMNSYLDCTWGKNSKFGQHPTGFYLEQYGADGNYDNMNLASIVKFYYLYKSFDAANKELVAKLHRSIEKNLTFKSFFWLPLDNNSYICPTAFNSRRHESTLLSSNPVGDYLASREFDLGRKRTELTPMPRRGVYPANVFSYYANTVPWGRRMLKLFVSKKNMRCGSGHWAMDVYKNVPLTAKQVDLPAEVKDGHWTLPGLLAVKKYGLYTLCFYDIDGLAANARNQGFQEGGPTAVVADGFGLVVSSMAPKPHYNRVEGEKDITFSCVYFKTDDGTLTYSGKKRASGKWLVEGEKWAITSEFAGNELTWKYAISKNGLDLSVGLTGKLPVGAMVNLPILERKGLTFEMKPGKLLLSSGDKQVVIAVPEGTVLTETLATANWRKVRCLRIPVEHKKEWTNISIHLK